MEAKIKNPLVSIVTPCFNSAKFIYECYESIRAQSYSEWEWLITDDASTDQSAQIISMISQSDPRVKPLFMKVNRGAAFCRNASIDNSQGQLIAFLDVDDLWRHDKLERQVAVHQKGIKFSFTSFTQFRLAPDVDGKIIDPGPERYFSYQDMLHKRATLGCSTVMLVRDIVGSKRMPDLRSGQDYAFWLSILREGTSAYLIADSMTFYRILPGSLSRNKLKKAVRQWQIYRSIEKLSFYKSLWVYKSYVINALTR